MILDDEEEEAIGGIGSWYIYLVTSDPTSTD